MVFVRRGTWLFGCGTVKSLISAGHGKVRVRPSVANYGPHFQGGPSLITHTSYALLQIFGNFEWLFTPQTWLRSARNFGKTRFRLDGTFHVSTPKTSFFSIVCKTLNLLFSLFTLLYSSILGLSGLWDALQGVRF